VAFNPSAGWPTKSSDDEISQPSSESHSASVGRRNVPMRRLLISSMNIRHWFHVIYSTGLFGLPLNSGAGEIDSLQGGR